MRYLVLCVPLVAVGCAAARKVAEVFTGEGGVDAAASAAAAAAPLIPGVWGKILGVLIPPVVGLVSKKAMDKAGVDEHESEPPAGLETE